MDEAGLRVERDAVGNVWGYLDGRDREQPIVATGSHIDSQNPGGRFDGALGVVAGIARAARRCASGTGSRGGRWRSSRWSRRKPRASRPPTSGARARSSAGSRRRSRAPARLRRRDDGGGDARRGTRSGAHSARQGATISRRSSSCTSSRDRFSSARASRSASSSGSPATGNIWSRWRARPTTPARRRWTCGATRWPAPPRSSAA